MSFIQIVEVRTKRYDELKALGEEFEASIADKTTVRRTIITRDRNDPERVLIMVFFDSYESAMENSNLPETAAFGEKQMPLLEGPPVFHDLDVVEDQ
ncbi:MAG TPA: hypothetical protein VFB78_19710 [Acidimicrobiales bacterium]|nr:hypothetical protein [Acidimicrobiales bacterium]